MGKVVFGTQFKYISSVVALYVKKKTILPQQEDGFVLKVRLPALAFVAESGESEFK